MADTDGCGVEKVELLDIENEAMVIFPAVVPVLTEC
jgi:hypothetical protein